MLETCMGKAMIDINISAPLPKTNVCHVRKHKHIGREFKMIIELISYEMDGIMLDMNSNVNILPKNSWEFMGK
jgi:hypothetical protein